MSLPRLAPYLFGDSDTPLTREQKAVLRARGMFTDEMVEFFTRRALLVSCKRSSPETALRGVFVLPPPFMQCLNANSTQMDLGPAVDREIDNVVSRWRLDLAGKEYVLVIANIGQVHWVLYVLVAPFGTCPRRTPVMLVFDSMHRTLGDGGETSAAAHRANFHILLRFLDVYAAQNGLGRLEEARRRYRVANVPWQPAGTLTCGLYTCLYVGRWCESEARRAELLTRVLHAPLEVVFPELSAAYIEESYGYLVKHFDPQ